MLRSPQRLTLARGGLGLDEKGNHRMRRKREDRLAVVL